MELPESQTLHRLCPHTFCTGGHLGPEGAITKWGNGRWLGLPLGGRREEIKSREGWCPRPPRGPCKK